MSACLGQSRGDSEADASTGTCHKCSATIQSKQRCPW
jgi:hypothetical protein